VFGLEEIWFVWPCFRQKFLVSKGLEIWAIPFTYDLALTNQTTSIGTVPSIAANLAT